MTPKIILEDYTKPVCEEEAMINEWQTWTTSMGLNLYKGFN